MSVEIAWKQNILVTDYKLLKSLLVVFGFGSQAFVCGFSRQNICSVDVYKTMTNFVSENQIPSTSDFINTYDLMSPLIGILGRCEW